jgi:hypothetical protein
MAMQQYVKSAPYVDLPLSELKKAIRDLNGIKPDSTPGQLELVLEKTGEAIALQLPRVPNLICREDVADEAPPQTGERRWIVPGERTSRRRHTRPREPHPDSSNREKTCAR